MRRKRPYDDGARSQLKLWLLADPVPAPKHRFKYSLFYGCPGRGAVAAKSAAESYRKEIFDGKNIAMMAAFDNGFEHCVSVRAAELRNSQAVPISLPERAESAFVLVQAPYAGGPNSSAYSAAAGSGRASRGNTRSNAK